jgi:hypothetical protein
LRPQTQEIWKARKAAEGILHRLCSRTFGYSLEEGASGWTLRVEDATDHFMVRLPEGHYVTAGRGALDLGQRGTDGTGQ